MAKIVWKTGASSARNCICVSPSQSIYSSYVRSKKQLAKRRLVTLCVPQQSGIWSSWIPCTAQYVGERGRDFRSPV